MRLPRAVLLAGIAAIGAQPPPAAAGDEVPTSPTFASHITVSAGLGYSYPVASAERGTDTRDVSFGIVPVSLGGTYDLGRSWSASVRALYAANIPTLCASGPDCGSSVGRDVWIAAGVGRMLPRWRGLTPQLELDVGWEWFGTRLSDSGVSSARSWNGPIASLGLFVDLKSGGPWALGPTASIGAGIFSRYELETPAGRNGGATAAAIHAWPMIGFRVGRRL